MNREGFTLIEVLIVVAIISVITLIFSADFGERLDDTKIIGMRENAKALETAAAASYISTKDFGTNGSNFNPDKSVQSVIESALLSKGYNYATTYPTMEFQEFNPSEVNKTMRGNKENISDFVVATNGPLEGTVFSKESYISSKKEIISGNNELTTIVPTDLVGYWNSKKGVSGNTWQNIALKTVGQYNATRSNAWVNATDGMEFQDAMNSYAVLPAPNQVKNILTPFTFEIRFKLWDINTNPYILADRDPNGGFEIDVGEWSGAWISLPHAANSTTSEGFWVPYPFEHFTDYILAISYDGNNTLKTYVNGELVRVSTTTQKIKLTRNGEMVIGKYAAGYVDDVRVYNRNLTKGEIYHNSNFLHELGGF